MFSSWWSIFRFPRSSACYLDFVVHLPINLSDSLDACWSVKLSIFQPLYTIQSICQSLCASLILSVSVCRICLSVSLPTSQVVFLSLFLFTSLSIWLPVSFVARIPRAVTKCCRVHRCIAGRYHHKTPRGLILHLKLVLVWKMRRDSS